MMNRVTLTAIALGLITSPALAGTIRFDPETVRIDLSTSGSTVTVDVYIESSGALDEITAVVMLLGANDLTITKFDLDTEFKAAFDSHDAVEQSEAINDSPYASGRHIQGFGFSASTAPIRVGTMTIDAIGLPSGSYVAGVDALVDGGTSELASHISGGENESLFGLVTVEVIGSFFPPSSAAGCSSSADCGAPGACTTVSCADGLCVSTPIQDCGECTTDADCNDGNPCTDGSCGATGCQFVENTAACNDNDPCTDGDVCAAFACSGTPVSGCSDTRVDPGSVSPDPTDPGTTDPGTTDPGGTDPGTTDPGSTDPSGTEPDPSTPGPTSNLCGAVGMLPLAMMLMGWVTSRRRAPHKVG